MKELTIDEVEMVSGAGDVERWNNAADLMIGIGGATAAFAPAGAAFAFGTGFTIKVALMFFN